MYFLKSQGEALRIQGEANASPKLNPAIEVYVQVLLVLSSVDKVYSKTSFSGHSE